MVQIDDAHAPPRSAWIALILAGALALAGLVIGGCTTWPEGIKSDFNLAVPPFGTLRWKGSIFTAPEKAQEENPKIVAPSTHPVAILQTSGQVSDS